MIDLTKEQYQKFGKDFLDFYMKNGFGNKSKSDIESYMYHLLVNIGIIDNFKSPLTIAKKLNISPTNIAKYEKWRYVHGCVENKDLDRQLKDIIQQNIEQESFIISRGKLTLTLYNSAVKLHLEELLQESGCNYDCSFSSNNISLTPKALLTLASKWNCDFKKALDEYINSAQPVNTETQTIINNISTAREQPENKWFKLTEVLIQSVTSEALKFLLTKTFG